MIASNKALSVLGVCAAIIVVLACSSEKKLEYVDPLDMMDTLASTETVLADTNDLQAHDLAEGDFYDPWVDPPKLQDTAPVEIWLPPDDCIDGCHELDCLRYGFEDASLEGWTITGDGSVAIVSELDGITPLEGSHMLALSLEPGQSAARATFYPCVPLGVERLHVFIRLETDAPELLCNGGSDGYIFSSQLGAYVHLDPPVSLPSGYDRPDAFDQLCVIAPIEDQPAGDAVVFGYHPIDLTDGSTGWIGVPANDGWPDILSGHSTTGIEIVLYNTTDDAQGTHTLLVDLLAFSGATHCATDEDCEDWRSCSMDSCGDASVCIHEWEPGCCDHDHQCDDDDDCTYDQCIDGGCSHTDVCCSDGADCDDDDPCTQDYCLPNWVPIPTMFCQNYPNPLCCDVDIECDDLDPCTIDTCGDIFCEYEELESCSFCGDGVCAAGEEASCEVDCDPVEAGCFPEVPDEVGETTGGCGGCACESCVCALMEECCTKWWQPQCAWVCKEYCGSCGGPSYCGDGVCNDESNLMTTESCASCPEDCGACPGCGDGTCSEGEDCLICPADCPQCEGPVCGDGVCEPWSETCKECPFDCGSCGGCTVSPVPGCGGECYCKEVVCDEKPECCTEAWDVECVVLCNGLVHNCGDAVCGDGMCGGDEPGGCLEDCGYCGDGVCAYDQEGSLCPQDCGDCGDGVCGALESEWVCPEDCEQ